MKRALKVLSVAAIVGGSLLWLVGHCRHKFSRPFTNMPWNKRKSYVVCLKCGAEFDFDLANMEVGEPRNRFDVPPKEAIL